ncbi:hypothetical protein ACMT4L_11980 [Deinococcus sp. A31D244]|uniref:hypothetical protein n=1 Tax=Deinococcus sp. A31D244 TaxID=3397675 RepID=UPI0039E1B52B
MTHEYAKTAAAAQHASLTPDDRRRALQVIEDRRAELTAELAQLDAISTGHRHALAFPIGMMITPEDFAALHHLFPFLTSQPMKSSKACVLVYAPTEEQQRMVQNVMMWSQRTRFPITI